MIQIGIIGGAGYTAGELIRILLYHSNAAINFVYSTSNSGNKVSNIHQDLVGSTNLIFTDKVNAEVDVVLQINGVVLPLEVKAAENLQAKSLRSYYNRYAPKKAFRTSLSGYREEDWLINLPLYSVHSIGALARHLP